MTDSVTVIIPTWNRAHTIGAAVQSVLAQTHTVLEILVCDDGSSDSTREVLNALNDNRISVIDGPRSGRPAVPRNRGILAAKGEWIAFLDSDDTWLPNKLESQLAAVKKTGSRAVCSNAWRVVPGKGRMAAYLNLESQELTLTSLLKTNNVICSSVLVQKSVLNAVGGFPEDEKLRAIEDFALWLRVSSLTPFTYIKDPLVDYTDDAPNSIRVDAKEQVQRENVMQNFYAWYCTQEKQEGKNEVKKTLKRAMKNNGRSLMERWKVN